MWCNEIRHFNETEMKKHSDGDDICKLTWPLLLLLLFHFEKYFLEYIQFLSDQNYMFSQKKTTDQKKVSHENLRME